MVKNNFIKFVYSLIIFYSWSLSFMIMGMAQRNETVMVKVGGVIDLTGMVGKMGLSCINMSLSDFYLSHPHYNTRIQFSFRDSHGDVVTAAAQALELIQNEQVQAILGPVTTMEANFMIHLGDKAHLPIITFSATSPSLSMLKSPYFFQIAHNDLAQVNAITSMVQAFGWKQVVPIYVDNSFGEGLIPSLTISLQQAYIRVVPYCSAISPSTTDEVINHELYKLRTMPTRVFVVHMSPRLGSRLFAIAKSIGMMEQGYVWIVTDGIANLLNSLNSSVVESMEGVLGVRPYVPKTKELDHFKARWKRRFLLDNPTLGDVNLNVFGTWAYDAATALAMAVEKVGATSFGHSNASRNLLDLEEVGVARSGEKLREALSNTRFRGLSGDFNVVGGALQASTLEIVNVIGEGGRRVGFWTPQKGIARNMDTKGALPIIYSTSKSNLGTIIWPGDTYSVPKGWEIPTSGRKLRIGVPVKTGDSYTEFVKITHDTTTNSTVVTGFCIDVFKAVLEALPFALPYEFIPFEKPDGEMAGTYNELISQVYYGNFDVVVGDTTIIANRSNYVDFTMPYTESGVTMVVPVKDNRKKNAWAFMKPLTWDLWVTSACSFIFIGFVVWVLEHRMNRSFRGPPSHQIGTSLWFSFSIMVFSHREKVVSNLARFVVTVWVFVVLILVQSYTASLSSLLTVEQLRPTITDVHQLLQNRMNVGYLQGSFVYGILKGLGFPDDQLKTYKSPEECNELFIKGSANGGIDAAFDEAPYVTRNHCSKYTTVEPRFKTGGFGYVFPKGSPLVADISRAILNVTQGDELKTIENAWFKKGICLESSTEISSMPSLGLESFWGLFLVAGIASLLALLIFAVTFLYQHRHIWLHYDPSTSIWRRIGILVRIFDQRDLECHTFKKSETSSPIHNIGAVETTPSTHCPPSPCSQSESNFAFPGDLSPDYEMNVV
ncbi:glutamate receptor 2.7-like [Lotus japonicus]|uniref:glutamate receptor 2.7-like n=1 Tax=Lotus japonicus TaxID=34305 RepID=UPI0025890C3E|nr:glutamate receptor 2.7-like [Lotus japonicus]